MADFTAVIRRAVEGLPEQSPELRARVYDKARSAVVRQMENMNPPPPEAMIKRQIDKIDAAIAEVESDFAVALPSDEEEIAEVEAFGDEAPVEDYAEPEAPAEEPYPTEEPYDEPPADEVAPEPEAEFEPEPEPEQPPQTSGFLQGATFEAVNRPDRVVYERASEPEDETSYSFDTPEDDEESDSGSVVVESDDHRADYDDWSYEAAPADAVSAEPAVSTGARPVSEKDWAHVDNLLGLEPDEQSYEDYERAAGYGRDGDEVDAGRGGGARRIGLAIAAVVILAIVAIGGYFVWDSRDTLTALVEPGDEVSETPAEPVTTPAAEPETAGTPVEETPAEGEAAGEKQFTQRLLPDGTEVDEGLPAAGASAGPARTVANQTSGASASSGAAQDVAAPAPPVGAAQKMYLYEEQLGQSVPSAYQGTVAWELKQENTGTAVSEPVIEGVMNVPEAGLSGVITFRRNDDSSLPASHLIDISFTVGENFQGGAIDNVQRISLKNTEAARGDPLIAVSAKITDDLYMLALNDFDQARGQNLALLAERNWIDIPITYRNGRRALLTLEKGTTGMAIFDRAVQEWQALGDIGDNN
ncbi:hypothetical protein [Martelella soudanensis]|uniref:hypothetical protein n=1 Tax=unclassified Martelella TaxID=2629616 RepID=UPI0015DFDAEB|nr:MULTISPECIES: hypothetical protein [unclassified Martelella]